jgi:Zn-dependent protease
MLTLNPLKYIDPVYSVLIPIFMVMIGGVPLIGWAKPVPVNIGRLRRHRTDYMLVAAAGPASNMLMALAASALLAVVPFGAYTAGAGGISEPLLTLISRALVINVLLAVFNMLPIPPLDGGNVIGGLLPHAVAVRYDALVRPYGVILLYALMFTRGFEYVVVAPARTILSWLL